MQGNRPHRDSARGKAPGRPKRLHGRPLPKPRLERGSPLRAEILSIGRELVCGTVADANGPALAQALTARGAVVHRITVVDDSTRAIGSSITEALQRDSRLVVTSGGLGPGADDRTLEAVADALSRPLTFHAGARRMVEEAYRRLRGRHQVNLEGLNAAREKMCSVPVGGEPIENPAGAAPGVLVRLTGGSAVLALPGVPQEARDVLDRALEHLRDLFGHGFVARREVEAPTRDESALRPVLDVVASEHPAVHVRSRSPGFGPGDAGITVLLEATGASRAEAESAVDGAVRRLLELAGGGS